MLASLKPGSLLTKLLAHRISAVWNCRTPSRVPLADAELTGSVPNLILFVHVALDAIMLAFVPEIVHFRSSIYLKPTISQAEYQFPAKELILFS
jgi:hypothetical protein